MALQMVVLASHGMNPILAGLAFSFLFKLSLNFDLLHQSCIDLWQGIEPGLSGTGGNRRWQQALQILYERIMNVRRSPPPVETGFDDLTMISL
ncbi:hypothetical protein HRI_004281600 [Hibiscus trionum]|uniref:Uncharacterized protein n=1 Tax=Hibiscus trionum TaxID=183268 RepID=A0A9W7J3E2_HIBTR|nr:hypothetical protein HRI_004281600 [Hibiscus trionum]